MLDVNVAHTAELFSHFSLALGGPLCRKVELFDVLIRHSDGTDSLAHCVRSRFSSD